MMMLCSWSTQVHAVANMTPLWTFPIYPLLLISPMAAGVIPNQPRERAEEMIVAAVAFQGIGFMIAVMIYSAYIYRLMTRKLPGSAARPGMFISVGPSSFTVIGIVQLGRAMEWGGVMAEVVKLGSLVVGMWLWGLACWFFLVAAGANAWSFRKHRLGFSLSWWSFVFPNTAFTLATFAIGDALGSRGIKLLGTVVATALVVVWTIVLAMTVRGVVRKEILWRGAGEDRDERVFVTRVITGGTIPPD